MHRNRNPCNSFLMVKMASGMDHGRMRPMTTTTTTTVAAAAATMTNDAAQHGGYPAKYQVMHWCSLGLQHISLILGMHIMCNWQLSYQEICWPVSHDHIAGSGLELIKVVCFFFLLTKCRFSLRSRAHVSLTCWKQGWIVRKPVTVFPVKPWTPEKISGMFIVPRPIRSEIKPQKTTAQPQDA